MLRLLREPQYLFGTLLVGVAVVVTVSLGLWQLDRLSQRRAHNALLEERRAFAPVSLPVEAGGEGEALHERLATAYGTFISEPTLILLNRSYNGEGGVRVVNLFHLADSGPYLWVERGWVPQRERNEPPAPPNEPVELHGYVHVLPDDGYPSKPQGVDWHQWIRLDPDGMTKALREMEPEYRGAEVLPYGLVMTQAVTDWWIPKAMALRELDDGPHLSYALQWFAFALIFSVGWIAYLWRAAKQRGKKIG